MDFKKNMENITGMIMRKNFWAVCCTVTLAFVLALNLSGCTAGSETEENVEEPQQDTEIVIDDSNESANINAPNDMDTDAMISINVANLGRANPFMPPGEKPMISQSALDSVASIPKERLQYDVLPPLETPAADENAKTAASTRVSGIMYDKSNPSAILNVNGQDYFVRSGDVLNGYKVLSIGKSIVTVQVGSNVYKAGVGQLVIDGQSGINYNTVANLQSKFGGNKK